MDEWQTLGRHRYRFADTILWFESHGDLNEAELIEYVAIYEKLLEKHPNLGILADVSRGLSTTPEVRRRASEVLKPTGRPVPIAIYGANVAVRTIFSLFTNAQRILYGKQPASGFFPTLPQATLWLERKMSGDSPGRPSKPPRRLAHAD